MSNRTSIHTDDAAVESAGPTDATRAHRLNEPRTAPGLDVATGAGAGPRSTTPRLQPPASPRGHLRWWIAVAVTSVASLPLAWMLSYAASLPFFIGLFFFVLLGLVIGAVAHRIAAANRPYSTPHLVAGTTVIVLAVWLVSIVKEASDFPRDMVRQAERVRDLGGRSIDEFRAAVEAEVRRLLAREHPPGGVPGYIRFVLRDGVIERGRLESVDRTLRAAQSGYTWALRAALSVALLGFGVASQTLLLRFSRERAMRAMDDRPANPDT